MIEGEHTRTLSVEERKLASLAAKIVNDHGGEMTFSEYDAAMIMETYWPPFNWICGWALTRSERKKTHDKMCAFVACEIGLIVQTHDGYATVA